MGTRKMFATRAMGITAIAVGVIAVVAILALVIGAPVPTQSHSPSRKRSQSDVFASSTRPGCSARFGWMKPAPARPFGHAVRTSPASRFHTPPHLWAQAAPRRCC